MESLRANILDENYEFRAGEIFFENGIITNIQFGGENTGNFLVPGFIDTHIHGAFGFDISDGKTDDIMRLSEMLPRFGVVAYCPTTMSLSTKQLEKVFEAVQKAQTNANNYSAEILGIHLEGPMLNPNNAAAQDKEVFLDLEDGDKLIQKLESLYGDDLLKIISLAPELNGGMDFIRKYSDKYVISLAHTAADYDTAKQAFMNGAMSATHVLNAMGDLLKRCPGVLGAVYDEKAFCEIICDGYHISPVMLRIIFDIIEEDKVIVISDSMRGSGMEDGFYMLGNVKAQVKDGKAFFGENANLAGSVTNLSEEYKRLVDFGISKRKIIKALTVNPLKRLRIDFDDLRLGYLKSGYRASFNLFDEENNLRRCYINGKVVYDNK